MTAQLSLSQARLIDPVLTEVAQGYVQPDFVGNLLFPWVPVDLSGGQVIQFGKENFMAYSTIRGPGGKVGRVQFGYLGKPYAVENHALSGQLPFELWRDTQVYPGIDLAKRAVMQPMRALLLELEVQQAGIAVNASNYDSNHKIALSGSSKWSDPSSLPIQQIDGYKENVRGSIGMYPNLATFSPTAWTAFKNNPSVTDRIKYTQKGLVTEDIAASLLGVDKVVVGKAVQADNSGAFTDVWGNNFLLAYTALGSIGAEQPSYAYTYVMRGNPAAEQPYWDPETRTWVYPVFFERVPVQTGITAGFLVQTPG